MIFNWNIDRWLGNEMPPELRDPAQQNYNFLQAMILPVKYLYTNFTTYRIATEKKMRYNGQIIVLENLLNDLFDPTQRRIIIINAADVLSRNFLFLTPENNPQYYYTEAEYRANPNLKRHYLYNVAEYGNRYDFIVQAAAGSLTAAQIVRLKATVNYYRIAS